MKKKGFLSYFGTIGSVVLGKICPVCYPAIGAFLTALGLGFALKTAVMKVMLIFFLGLGVLGLRRSGREHGKKRPLLIAIASGLVIYTGKYIRPDEMIFYIGVAGLITAVVMDIWFKRGKAPCGACNVSKLKRRLEPCQTKREV